MEAPKLVVYFPLIVLLCNFPCFLAQTYYVRNFNAIGDGKTDDTKAVRAALAAAASSNGGRVLFDAGYTFLTGTFNVTSNVILDVRGKILGSNQTSAYSVTSTTGDYDPLIRINKAKNITITGGGVVDGQGRIWWPCAQSPNTANPPCYNRHRPRILYIQDSSGITVNHITLQNSPMQNIALVSVKNVHIYNISLLAPSSHASYPSHNTDGIDVNGQNIVIENSYISVGDDAIAIGGSNGLSNNITIRNLTIGSSHGISIGSYTQGGVANVIFENIVMNGSDSGPRIKSQRGRGGVVQNVTFSNIQLYNMDNCIGLTMNYSKAYIPPSSSNTPIFKNIIINNLSCQNANEGWWLEGLPESVIQASFSNIQINAKTLFGKCTAIAGSCSNSTVKPYCPPCMQIVSSG